MKAVVSERGQVTIPKKLRERLGIEPGEVLDFAEENGRLVAVKLVAVSRLDKAFGILKPRRRTDDVMLEIRGSADAVDP